MVIDPRSTSQLGLKTLEQNQKELLSKVSAAAEARIIKTVDVLVKASAPLSTPQRQLLESNTATLNNSVKVLLQKPVLYLLELEVEGKTKLSISPTLLPEGSKFAAQLTQIKGLLNELSLTQPIKLMPGAAAQTTTHAGNKPPINFLAAEKNTLPILTNALREALPKQTPEVIRQTFVTAELINKLPAAVGEKVISKPTQDLLKQLAQFPTTPTQLKNPVNLQAAMKNSGLFLENQLANKTPLLPSASQPALNTALLKGTNKGFSSPLIQQNSQQPRIPTELLQSSQPSSPLAQQRVEALLNAPTRERLLHAWRNLLASIAANKHASAPDKIPKTVVTPPSGDDATKSLPDSAAKNKTVPTSDLKGLLLNLKASLEKNDLSSNLLNQKSDNTSANTKLSAANIPILLKNLLTALSTGSNNNAAGATNNQSQQQVANLVYQQVLFSLARIQHQQLQSLVNNPRLGAEPNINPLTHLNIELPVKFMDQPQTVNIDIEEEWRSDDNGEGETNKKTRQWKVTLYFDLPTAGGFYAQLIAIEENVSVKFWADKQETLTDAKEKLEALKASLSAHGVTVKEAQCMSGKPPQKNTRLEYSLVDITT